MSSFEEIYLLNKRVKLRLPLQGFRPGMDSVMLASACSAQNGQSILDLGCGVGSAGLCVLTRIPDTNLKGIEIQPDHVELSIQNAIINNMEKRAEFICQNIRNFKDGCFDHVICNPPFLESGSHLRSPDNKKASANGLEDDISLKNWMRAAFDNLKSGGILTIIHRADMIDKIIQGLGKSYGAIEIIPLWPKAGIAAKRVIIRAIKDRKSPAIINPGIILHNDNGGYTKRAEAILRNMDAL
ncbi:MAG: methyltransferase [Alphaproteobacteria bacterium]|nr:methyltransferase [Alphaproteobacteria bacterium]